LSGTHKTTGKDVSVWIFEKRVIDGVRSQQLKETVLETLRKEVESD
jgi:SCY1-like protein 2